VTKPARRGSRQYLILAVVVLLGGGAVGYQFWPDIAAKVGLDATVPQQVAAAPQPKETEIPWQTAKKAAATSTARTAANVTKLPPAAAVRTTAQDSVQKTTAATWQADPLGIEWRLSTFSSWSAADLKTIPQSNDDALIAWRQAWATSANADIVQIAIPVSAPVPDVKPVAVTPTAPPVAVEPPPVKSPPVDANPVDVSRYNVTTIMATPHGAKAVINGHVVGAGQEIDGAKVISIDVHEVELEIGGRRAKINL
jgi:hypothetical protein